jgi:hypothetical protein
MAQEVLIEGKPFFKVKVTVRGNSYEGYARKEGYEERLEEWKRGEKDFIIYAPFEPAYEQGPTIHFYFTDGLAGEVEIL